MAARRSLFRVYNRTLQRYSNLVFHGVLNTPSITTDPDADTVVYTVLDRGNVRAYLLAAKSFLRYCPPMRVVIQSDGSLDERWRDELESQIQGIQILERDESIAYLDRTLDPELKELLPELESCHFFLSLKLLNVFFRFRGQNVILFDSDLLFLRRPDPVLRWIEGEGQAFHGGGGNNLTDAFRQIGFDFSKVDINRFNAGFFGFRNTYREEDLLDVVRRIREHDPALFSCWEIEQAMWAVLLNLHEQTLNIDDLAEDYVGNGWRTYNQLLTRSVLVHFVGATRFKNLTYPRLAQLVMRELRSAAGVS